MFYCLLIVHSIATPLCFYFEQAFAFKTAFDYSCNCNYLSSYMKERGILQGVLCLVGGVLSRGRYDRLPRFLFFASRWQNAATILAEIVQAPQVWLLCILEQEQWKLLLAFVLMKSLNIKKNHRRNSMWLWNKSSVSAECHLADGEVYLSYHSWEGVSDL